MSRMGVRLDSLIPLTHEDYSVSYWTFINNCCNCFLMAFWSHGYILFPESMLEPPVACSAADVLLRASGFGSSYLCYNCMHISSFTCIFHVLKKKRAPESSLGLVRGLQFLRDGYGRWSWCSCYLGRPAVTFCFKSSVLSTCSGGNCLAIFVVV